MQAFARIDTALEQIAALAGRLTDGDPGDQVRRSVEELRTAFDRRASLEPAIARLQVSVRSMTGHQFPQRALGVDRLNEAIDQDLLPELRRIGFEV